MQTIKNGICDAISESLEIDKETLIKYLNEETYYPRPRTKKEAIKQKEQIKLHEIFRYMILNNISDIEELRKEYPYITEMQMQNATNNGIFFLACMKKCNQTSGYTKKRIK